MQVSDHVRNIHVQKADFPLDALPEGIRQFAEEAAASLSGTPELVAIPALVVTAAAIGGSRVIQLKPDWQEPSSLFAAVVSPSGAMKSPALKMAAKPLQNLDAPEKRTWTSDVTVERLAKLLSENPRGLLLIRDELSGWVKSMNQYRQGKGADRQFYLSVWGGAPIMVDRVGDGTPGRISVAHPCLSVVGCIPPDVLEELDDRGGIEDGFLPRLLFAWPPQRPVRWTDVTISKTAREAYDNLIQQLFALPFKDEPVALSLSPEAHAVFVQWHDAHCQEIEQPTLQPFLKAAYSKLKGYCARLALIHALATNPTTDTVEAASVEAAIQLINYFKAQARKVMPLISRNKSNTAVERCKSEIRRKLSVSRIMKRRDLQKNSAFDAEVFKQALAEMGAPEVIADEDGSLKLWGPANRQHKGMADLSVQGLPDMAQTKADPIVQHPEKA